jgi:hypothetical protein
VISFRADDRAGTVEIDADSVTLRGLMALIARAATHGEASAPFESQGVVTIRCVEDGSGDHLPADPG